MLRFHKLPPPPISPGSIAQRVNAAPETKKQQLVTITTSVKLHPLAVDHWAAVNYFASTLSIELKYCLDKWHRQSLDSDEIPEDFEEIPENFEEAAEDLAA